MRSFSLVGAFLLAACGVSELEQRRLNDGSWEFTCQLSMVECIQRVQEHCPNQRFRILEGTSETRLRDAPPFERAYHTSRLHLACTDDGAKVLLSIDSSTASVTKSAACSIGETRACVGAGACKGGQTCLPDGKGFGNCNCGPVAPTGVSPADATPREAPSAPPPPLPDAAPASPGH